MSAKAVGLGNLGGDINSNEKELYLVVNVSQRQVTKSFRMLDEPCYQPGAVADRSEPPPPLNYKMEGHDEALGVSSCDR